MLHFTIPIVIASYLSAAFYCLDFAVGLTVIFKLIFRFPRDFRSIKRSFRSFMDKGSIKYVKEFREKVEGAENMSDDQIASVLSGETKMVFSSVVPDEASVREIQGKYERDPEHWKKSRWLIICCSTSDMEQRQRKFECESFIALINLPRENITYKFIETNTDFADLTQQFLDNHGGKSYHAHIIFIGYGLLRTSGEPHEGSLVVPHKAFGKVHVGTSQVMELINEVAKRCKAQRNGTGSVFMSLFYCYARGKQGKVQSK